MKAFTAAVLGGIGNLGGAMVGGVLLGLIEQLGAGYIGNLTGGVFGSNYQDVFAFVVLIVVLVFRPSGLLGWTCRGSRVRERSRQNDVNPTDRASTTLIPDQHAGRKLVIGIVTAVLVIAAPMIIGAAGGNYWVRVLDFAMLYVMLALGLTWWSASPACWTWGTSRSMRSARMSRRSSRRLT